MKDLTIFQVAEAAIRGAVIVVEVTPRYVQPGDVIFWDGAWRTVERTELYRMKENHKVFMTATGFEGQTFIKRFDLPRHGKVLKRLFV